MKSLMFTFCISVFTLTCNQVVAQDIFGLWWTTDKKSMIKIYHCGDELCGKVAYVPNPDPQGEKIEGNKLLSDFKQKKEHVWKKGRIYDPRKGKSYKAKLTLEGDKLKVRGFIGVSLFGKTKTWTRVKDDPRK